jgi:hypothetical protein
LESEPDANESPANEESIARLFKRLFYTKISNSVPMMTGDIFQIDSKRYGIIVSPECDIRRIQEQNGCFEMLVVENDGFDKFVLSRFQDFTREKYQKWQRGNKTERKKADELNKVFNQTDPRFHILPSFPMSDSLNQSVVIQFSLGRELHRFDQVKTYAREYKLNSPFIQQLRQRYLSYLGRIGAPSLPSKLRSFNLK